jgi:class 3 adenylate cyclase
MGVVVHKGVLFAFRDFVWGRDVNIVAALERVASRLSPAETIVLVTGQVRGDLVGSEWDAQFQHVDVKPSIPVLADIEIYRLGNR